LFIFPEITRINYALAPALYPKRQRPMQQFAPGNREYAVFMSHVNLLATIDEKVCHLISSCNGKPVICFSRTSTNAKILYRCDANPGGIAGAVSSQFHVLRSRGRFVYLEFNRYFGSRV
jgi:hypothetical protein